MLTRDAWVRGLSMLGLGLTIALVTQWWFTEPGSLDFGDPVNALDSSGRLTALLGSDLLLAQVLMMARVPWLERAFGQDRLAHFHRLVGFTSFDLTLAHVVLTTWAYADGNVRDVIVTFWDLTIHYPGMLLATVGTAMLVVVVITSVRIARSRLRYESWHLLHLYGYLGAGLALPHQLWTGTEFTDSTGRTVFWWSAWGVTAGAVIWWRILRPLRLNLKHRLYVAKIAEEAPGLTSVYLSGRKLRRLTSDPGQFFLLRFLGRPGWTRAHPFSMSADPGRYLRFTVQRVGDGSSAIQQLKPGTKVLFEGPFGRLGERARSRDGLLFIGAGVGLAPLRALAEGMDYGPGEAVMLARYTAAPLFKRELDDLTARRGLRVVWLPGKRRKADSWLGSGLPGVDDVEALVALVPDVRRRDVYVCGPDVWIDRVRAALYAAGVHRLDVHIERFSW